MATKKLLRNNVALVLDDSGSMLTISKAAQKAFNKALEDLKRESTEKDQKTNVSIIYFGRTVDIKDQFIDVHGVKPITYYNPRQTSTALFDGVFEAVAILDDVVELKTYDDSYLVLVVTDGEENHSKIENISNAPKMLYDKQEHGNWTFVFMVPRGCRDVFCRAYNIPTDNVLEWDQTDYGTQCLSESLSAGLAGYYDSRSIGVRSVQNFFVQPDLSKVNTKQIKKKLIDISGRCKQYTLAKEASIKEFVEEKTKRPYVLGTAYYQLMKTEKVQAKKKVLLVEKGKTAVWAGKAAREMIGLPDGADAKVEPGNHANYDIYIESRSVNRKLPRGTKLIVVE